MRANIIKDAKSLWINDKMRITFICIYIFITLFLLFLLSKWADNTFATDLFSGQNMPNLIIKICFFRKNKNLYIWKYIFLQSTLRLGGHICHIWKQCNFYFWMCSSENALDAHSFTAAVNWQTIYKKKTVRIPLTY